MPITTGSWVRESGAAVLLDLCIRLESLSGTGGRGSEGLLTHFLPVLVPYFCSHMQPVDRAAVDIRVLEEGPSKPGVRVIGRVYKDVFANSEPAAGVNVQITGPGGTIPTVTDRQEIFDRSGLPAGYYSVRMEEANLRDNFYSSVEGDVISGETWGGTLIAHVAPRQGQP